MNKTHYADRITGLPFCGAKSANLLPVTDKTYLVTCLRCRRLSDAARHAAALRELEANATQATVNAIVARQQAQELGLDDQRGYALRRAGEAAAALEPALTPAVQLLHAAQVIALTVPTRAWLAVNDPKALEQLDAAIRAQLAPEPAALSNYDDAVERVTERQGPLTFCGCGGPDGRGGCSAIVADANGTTLPAHELADNYVFNHHGGLNYIELFVRDHVRGRQLHGKWGSPYIVR